MQKLIEEMRLAVPAAFEGDDYRNQLRALEERAEEEVAEQWRSLKQLAERHNITVLQTPTGYVLAPVVRARLRAYAEADPSERPGLARGRPRLCSAPS